ncbi:TRAP transporter small permease [Ruegeria sp. PrR005]|uniref:TRAP transporter small permease protein n=1 Tax=Ruegeria sp. PrR005 TaxID=2706882 RepID=A0A6B2NQR5_9RHOB|nr:TRAP transporter small permease [Ruegeria sp. PrR005]NDW44185.1 TRAP transporter small permease [Ruegeria sp. PrR005]
MLRSILKGLTLTESIVATAAYALVAALLMVDVIGREVFSSAVLGLQQIAVYGAIIAGFLGLTLATTDNSHLRPEFLDFLAGRHGHEVARVGDVLSAVFFFAGSYVAWTFVQTSMDSGDKAPVLYFALWPLQLIIPYAFGSAGVKHLIFAIRPDLKIYSDKPAG